MTAPGPTFGVELEFLAVYPRNFFCQPRFDAFFPHLRFDPSTDRYQPRSDEGAVIADPRQRRSLRAVLAQLIHNNGANCVDVAVNGYWNKDYSAWIVETEDGKDLSPGESTALGGEYVFEPLEVVSRVLQYDDPATWHRELGVVMDVIAWLKTQGVHCIANESTGLHVHVGYGAGTVPLYAAKRLLQLHLAFEDRLDRLYYVPRFEPTDPDLDGEFQFFIAPLTSIFAPLLGEAAVGGSGRWIAAQLTKIERCSTMADFMNLFTLSGTVPDGHYSVLNFDNLFDWRGYEGHPPNEPIRTVEFRQHQGTLNPAEIKAYVILCVKMADFCVRAGEAGFLNLLAMAADQRFGILSLLQAVGVPEQGIDWYRARISPDRDSFASRNRDNTRMRSILASGAGIMPPSLHAFTMTRICEEFDRGNALAVHQAIAKKRREGRYVTFGPPLGAAQIAETWRRAYDLALTGQSRSGAAAVARIAVYAMMGSG